MNTQRERRGVALIATLTIVVAIAAVAAMTSASSHDDRLASANRVGLVRGRWQADACAALVVAQFDKILGVAQSPATVNAAWSSLDTTLSRVQLPDGINCTATLTSSGTKANVNSMSRNALVALIDAADSNAPSDSMADALIDWRDADSVESEFGAEAQYYQRNHRPTPRNDRLRSTQELRLVHGWEHADAVITLLSVDSYRVVLDRAPLAVLRTVSDLPEEATDWIDHHRSELKGRDVSVMLDHLSLASQRVVSANYARLRAQISAAPEAWFLDCSAPTSAAHIMRVRLTLVRASGHVSTVKRDEESL